MSTAVHVSDHALIRWIERVKGISLDFCRDEISRLTADALEAGATSVTIDGHLYCLNPKTGTVATVLDRGMRNKRSVKTLARETAA